MRGLVTALVVRVFRLQSGAKAPHSKRQTMNQSLNDYLGELESRRYSHSRLTHVRRTIEMLMLYLKESHQVADWRAVNENHLSAFAVFAATRHQTPKGKLVSPDTLRQWLSCVRGFFAWMNETGRLVHNPADRLKPPRKGQPLPHVLSESEIAQLIESPDDHTTLGLRDRALMELLYATGIRLAEAHKLDLYDADTSTRLLIVRQGKGGRDRIVPLTETASRWLSRYIIEARLDLASGLNRTKRRANQRSKLRTLQPRAPTPALWLTIEGRRLSKQMIAQRVTEYASQANLKATVHTFRHSCATHLLRGGASIRHVQQLLGHRGLETTEIYTHVEIEDLKRAVDQASSSEAPVASECSRNPAAVTSDLD
ncbi:MAG TPA: tyrosine-type recombinase/integrase [Blastocatellia bacterium]|nr:tyrosine-type recombinase/integrase [Blastocatellia bacterium]